MTETTSSPLAATDDRARDFWRRELADASVGVSLPPDLMRREREERGWSATTAPLEREQRGVPLTVATLTAVEVVLARFTATDDFVLWVSPGMLGQPVDIPAAPRRVRYDSADTVAGRRRDVETWLAAASAHARVADDAVADHDWHGPDGRTTAGIALDGEGHLPVDLLFRVDDSERTVGVEHRADRVGARTAAALLDALVTLLRAFGDAAPAAEVGHLPLLDGAGYDRVVHEWSGGARAAVEFVPVADLVARHAASRPDAVAVVGADVTMTYRELDRAANRVAHRLRSAGVGAGDVVALCTTRSPRMIVGMLAAMRAGAAYLPLDAGHPPARLEYLLSDADPAVLLTELSVRDRLPATTVPTIELDTDPSQTGGADDAESRQAATAPASDPTPDDVAYVIYTSGSTGRPKGVEITLGGLHNLIAWHLAAYGITESDRTTQIAGTAFDASVWEIWPTLAAGAALHLAADPERLAAADLVDWLCERRITVAFLPTPLAELVLAESWPARCALRYLLTGGDLLHAHPRRGLPFTLVNHYGPTENTVVSTAGAVPPGVTDQLPSIGRPIAGTTAYLLDERMLPVPPGVPGELHVGGAGLARGYRGRPELTEDRFVVNPFGPGRLYRTGDLCAWRDDGSLSFLGRVDTQVKLHGVRIELGEIEAALTELPPVAEATALLREDSPGKPVLTAYVVPRTPGGVDPMWLRARLAERLASQMVPSAYVLLDALPLTRNGKVDRAALPAPDTRGDRGLGDYVAPAAGAEALVAALWQEVLGVDQVGALDDFFALGGTSLAATRVVARLREEFGVRVPLSAVLATPTVRGLGTLLGERDADGGEPPLVAVARGDDLPLTVAQRQMWLLDRIDASGIAYQIPLAIELDGPLRVAALHEALRGIVARHEPLRTTFPVVGGEPVQRVATSAELPLPVVDQSDVDDVDEWVVAESREPLDITTGPQLRALLLRRSEVDHLLLLVVHHIAFDGWSLGVFCDELALRYESLVRGEATELAPLTVQSGDLAAWQAAALTDDALAAELAYWPTALAGAPEALELPTDFPRPETVTSDGGRRVRMLDAELADRLRMFARDESATPFMAMFAGFAVLLSRYTGATDIVVGSPVAGRVRPELEPLIGCFINTVPLRTDLSGEPSFRELLARVRTTALAAHDNQNLSFSRIVRAAGADRFANRQPLSQVVFAFEDAHDACFSFDGIAATVTEIDFGSTRSDLGVSVTVVDGRLRVCAEYRTNLFTSDTIDRLLGQYATLLAGLLAEPDTPVTTVPLLTGAERRLMVEDWNDTAGPFEDDAAVHELIERQVDATPDATAVVFETERTLSYRELDERANRLAHRLRELGVGRESRVGVCLHRSPEMVVAVVAVLKAGGGYVPLDPANPRERQAFIIEDAGLEVVLTERALGDVSAWHGAEVVRLDVEWVADAGGYPASRPELVTGPRDLAYVIYTSGSTGRPKGVQIEHRSVCNFMANVHRLFEMGAHDTVLQFASLGFDVSVFEIFGALTCGARLCLARQETLLSVRELTAFLQRHEITVMDMPPSMMALLSGADFPALRIAFVGGEAFAGALVNDWARPGRRFFNGYGPTEGTVTVIIEECTGASYDRSPPIGRPMGNMRAYVLDAERRLVPVGVPGELHIGGAGLARGYLNRPELTEEKFVVDPFVADPGARLYRTGDLVRQLPDGRLEFLGRVDDQVKLRGFRIEPGEVESMLREHPDVVDAAVVLREDEPGQHRLVGYVTTEASADRATLAGYLAGRLPKYMLPAAYVFLDRLPLNSSGKIDRTALPPPSADDLAPAGERVAPSNRRERTIAEIWCQLLGVAEVGVHDDFFGLGGHSLLGVRLVWEIHRAFGVDISIRDVFAQPTVAGLAAVVEEAMLAVLAREATASEPRPDDTEGGPR